jgi:hypothetical protein
VTYSGASYASRTGPAPSLLLPPAPASTLYTFTATDGTQAFAGPDWVGDLASVLVSGNAAYSAAAGVVVTDVGTRDYTLDMDWTVATPNLNLIIRGDASPPLRYWLILPTSILWADPDEAPPSWGNIAAGLPAIVSGDHVRVVAHGTSVNVYVNASPTPWFTSAAQNMTGTYVGWQAAATADAGRLDNLRIAPDADLGVAGEPVSALDDTDWQPLGIVRGVDLHTGPTGAAGAAGAAGATGAASAATGPTGPAGGGNQLALTVASGNWSVTPYSLGTTTAVSYYLVASAMGSMVTLPPTAGLADGWWCRVRNANNSAYTMTVSVDNVATESTADASGVVGAVGVAPGSTVLLVYATSTTRFYSV